MTQFEKSIVVMLPTEKASDKAMIIKRDITNILQCTFNNIIGGEHLKGTYQHLYFLSDEEIKEGDWVLWNMGNEFQVLKIDVIDYTFERQRDECIKIIAATDPMLSHNECTECRGWGNDQKGYCSNCKGTGNGKIFPRPSDSFIKKYCELGGIDEVMVEYEDYLTEELALKGSFTNYRLKISPDNTITIKKVKDSWSKEEVIQLFTKYKNWELGRINWSKESLNKWIEENL